MPRSLDVRRCGLLLTIALCAFNASRAADAPSRPNIILILADDLGWSDTTLFGTTSLYETPNIERLAARGMTFDHAYSASPLCSPTRASILTGQNPARLGITAPRAHQPQVILEPSLRRSAPAGDKALQVDSASQLDPSVPTLPQLLKQAGYATGHFGKWHLGHEPYSPLEHGFDVDIPHWPGPGPAGSFVAPWKFPNFKPRTPHEHIEDRMAHEAIEWLKSLPRDQPFFLNYWQFSVHAPFDAKQELIDRYRPRIERSQVQNSPTYAAMVASLDEAVGRLLDAVDEAGIADRTVILFYSDNGGNMYNGIRERDQSGQTYVARPTSNAPLRGGKATMYEGGIRVPAIVAWPGLTAPGSRSSSRIQSTDLYPTLLTQLEIPFPENHPLDGVDMTPAPRGEAFDRGPMFTFFPHSPPVPDWLPPSISVHHEQWKLIRLFHQGEQTAHAYRLYDLRQDVGERKNLADEYPEKVAVLDGLIEDYIKSADVLVPRPNPAFDPSRYQPQRIGVQPGGLKVAPPRRDLAPSSADRSANQPAKPAISPARSQGSVTPPRPPSLAVPEDARSDRKPATEVRPQPQSPSTVSRRSPQAPPNVIVFYTDDHGYADLSCQDIVQDVRTPHVDALAARGVRAVHGYSTAPQCVPSRGGLLTGRFQSRFGLENNGSSLEGFNRETTIAERLQSAKYVTAQFGKWHLGPSSEITTHGFRHVFAQNANRPFFSNITLDGLDRPAGEMPHELYHVDGCSRAAASLIERYRDQPFFFYIAYRAPHVPLDAPPKYLSRFPGEMPERRRQALAMLSAVDDGVGLISRTLEQCGLTNDTLIFYIGDNGAPLKIHKADLPGGGPGWDGSLNDPLNGEKGMLSEGGMHVPFVISWPGHITAGQDYPHPVSALDVAATAAAVAKLDVEPGKLDGVDLVPYLSGVNPQPPHQSLMWRWSAQSAIRSGRWKLLRGGDREYLYDLQADLPEKTNLATKHPEIAQRLREELTAWSRELSPPGLAVGPMAQTWHDYFDYYLDGKPAPRPAPSARDSADNDPRIQGWVARNCRVTQQSDGIRVRPDGQRQGPFLAQTGLALPPQFTVRARVRLPQPTSEPARRPRGARAVKVAWRLADTREFTSAGPAEVELQQTRDWQTVDLSVAAEARVIHIRLLLPDAGLDIGQITLLSSDGKPLRQWNLSGEPASREGR